MSKKILSVIMSMVVATSLAGCGNKSTDGTKSSGNTNKVETKNVEKSEEDSQLEGEWAKDYTLDETKKLYENHLKKMEDITKGFEIKYSKEEVIKNYDEAYITDSSMYYDNEKAEANKISNMSFGLKLYGEKLESGVIELKLMLNFDSENAIKNNNFDLGKTSFAKYISAFTNQENRDYSEINKEIIEKLKAGENEVMINNTVNGLKEEIIADKKCIFYKLSTKKYVFADAEMSME
ncbi:MAG: hypothetical protein E7207_06155 [Clostridium butyricum]|nr:hypothetical protein [Clostridium butyricum]